MRPGNAPVPVTILTGFLGSGKTTLLNRLLRAPDMTGTAVIINEFGEVGLDHLLVETGDDTVIQLSNGCLCCTVRGQLSESLARILARGPERVIIETTGLADPVPVIQAIVADPALSGIARMASLVTVFDVLNAAAQIGEHQEAARQLALADFVILSKLDRAGDPEAARRGALHLIGRQAPGAVVIDAETLAADPGRIGGMTHRPGGPGFPDPQLGHAHHGHVHDVNRHSAAIRAVTLRAKRPLRRQDVEMFCDLLMSAHGSKVLRLKGLVAVEGTSGPLLIHGVRGSMEELRELETWPGEDRTTRIVVFLDGIEPDFVRRLFDGFAGIAAPDTADRAALTANPLAVPGMP